MSDRFDFEQQLMTCWNITEDIKLLNEYVLEHDEIDKDQISNFLLGLETIYEMKFNKMFEQFSQMVKDGKIT